MKEAASAYVALLRGINVGGHSTVPMAALRACFEQLGFGQVRTYINSGNVIFSTSEGSSPRQLEALIEPALVKAFALDIRVIVRSAEEVRQTVAAIPASWQHATDRKCNVIFLHHTIDSPSLLEQLHPKPGIEELHYHPGVLFWSAKTSDLAKSSMVKLSRSPLYREMTVRGLSTLHAIYRLLNSLQNFHSPQTDE